MKEVIIFVYRWGEGWGSLDGNLIMMGSENTIRYVDGYNRYSGKTLFNVTDNEIRWDIIVIGIGS